MGRLIDADKLSFYGFFDAGDYSIVRQTIYNAPMETLQDIIQQKIDKLKGVEK